MAAFVVRSLRNIYNSSAAYRVAFTSIFKIPATATKCITYRLENKYVTFRSSWKSLYLFILFPSSFPSLGSVESAELS